MGAVWLDRSSQYQLVGFTIPFYSIPFLVFHKYQSIVYLLHIMIMSGRCHRSWAAATHGRYERDLI